MDEEKQEHIIIDYKKKPYKQGNLDIGVGLNQVDNLKPSSYFYKAISESKTYGEIEDKLTIYYHKQNQNDPKIQAEKECDLVSIRIAQILDENHFKMTIVALKNIHKKLFSGVFSRINEKYVGNFRDYNIEKKEPILDGDSVNYGQYDEMVEYLEYDLEAESRKNYALIPKEQWSKNIAKFVSNIWEIHPFAEGNTRTTAVFTIKYLRYKNIPCDNTLFKEKSKYFRNALVLANYGNMQKGITPDSSYLESFFKKLIENPALELKKMPKNIMDKSHTFTQKPKTRPYKQNPKTKDDGLTL